MNNEEKINLVIKDLKQWADGSSSLDSMIFALNNGFRLHAASLWLSTGAASEEVLSKIEGIKIDHVKEKKEIKDLLSIASVFVCKKCNSHHFLLKSEVENVEDFLKDYRSCESCLSTEIKLSK